MSANYEIQGQMSIFDLSEDIWCGRTFPEPSPVMVQRISERSLKKLPKLSIKMPLFLDLRTENGHQPDASFQTDGRSLGEFMTHNGGASVSEENGFVCYATLMAGLPRKFFLNCGEKPRIPVITKLTNSLEQSPDKKYMLSPRACQGTLNRAEKRGKELPKVLRDALIAQASLSKSEGGPSLTGTGPRVLLYDEKAKVVEGLKGIADTLSEDDRETVKKAIELLICIEGNGARPSHMGDGYSESETMYTLNTTEQHAVAYRKTSHPKTSEEGQGWEEAETNDTVNAFDNSENHPQDSRVKIREDGICQTLDARMGMGGGNVPMVMENPGDGYVPMVAATRSAADGDKGVHSQMLSNPEENFVVGPVASVSKSTHMTHAGTDNVGQTLVASDWKESQVVAYGLDRASYNQGKNAKYGFSVDEDRIGAQTASGPGAVCTSVVRRLTPKECERLQGFPDNWTNIGDWKDSKGKLHKGESDAPRYKALGNSIALPFWRWLSRRIADRLRSEGCKDLSMASLFDGIGGFPLVFSECGVTPVWASEIEEFPIAVTRIHFPEKGE